MLALVIAYHLACIALLAMSVVFGSFIFWTFLSSAMVYANRPNSFLNPRFPKRDFNMRERLIWLIGAALCAVTGFGISYKFWPDDPFQWLTGIMAGTAFWALVFLMVRDCRFVLRSHPPAH